MADAGGGAASDGALAALGLRIELQQAELGESRELKWLVRRERRRGAAGKLVAELVLRDVAGREEREGFVKAVSLAADLRGRGVGRLLLERCKAHMRDELLCASLFLEAEEDMSRFGKLVALYEAAGFRVADGVKRFKMLYNGDETFRVVPMRCTLGGSCVVGVDGRRVSLAFAQAMCDECRTARRREMTLWDALQLAGRVDVAVRAMRMVEKEGHPDWMQFLALTQHLGSLQREWHWASAPAPALLCQLDHTWVADCTTDAMFSVLSQAEQMAVLANQADAHHEPVHPAPGLDDVQLVWSDDEYLYRTLLASGCTLPREGLRALRFRRMDHLLETGCFDDAIRPEDRPALRWIHLFADLSRRLLALAKHLHSTDPPMVHHDVDEQRARFLLRKFASPTCAF